jgi:hypothetical protein
VHWIGEYVLVQLETGQTWRPNGNAAAGFAPHDAFPTRGEDQWVAIAVADDSQWQALCALMGRPDLAAADRAGPDGHAAITAWTSTRDKIELAGRLQAGGVPAAPVLAGGEIATSLAVWAAGLVVTLDHPRVGRRDYGALGFRHERTPGGHHHAAPLFGQHNDTVLRDLLGYDDERIAQLRATGAVADRPTADTDTPRTLRPDTPPDIPSHAKQGTSPDAPPDNPPGTPPHSTVDRPPDTSSDARSDVPPGGSPDTPHNPGIPTQRRVSTS